MLTMPDFFPKEGKSKILSFLSEHIQRLADLTIVTNEALLNHVLKNGGRGFVLPDKVPNLHNDGKKSLKGKTKYYCSFVPTVMMSLIKSFSIRPENLIKNIFIYVTGDYRKKGLKPASMPRKSSYSPDFCLKKNMLNC